MCALAGPLHGLANQGCLRWLLQLRDSFTSFPTREQLEEFVWDWLNAGQVVPGYGHAVLRTTDPRFTVQVEFADRHCPEDELLRLVKLVYEVVPGILQQLGKVSNPWPNVDAVTGALQYHYGVRELDIYTVMFGVSRILGLTSNSVWARALGYPLERPKALTTSMLEGIVNVDLD
jgi:citrate synthase